MICWITDSSVHYDLAKAVRLLVRSLISLSQTLHAIKHRDPPSSSNHLDITMLIPSVLLIAAQVTAVSLSHVFNDTTTLQTRDLMPRSRIADSCSEEHSTEFSRFVLQPVKDMAYWGLHARVGGQLVHLDLDDRYSEILRRIAQATMFRWFGDPPPGEPGPQDERWVHHAGFTWRMTELWVETGGTLPGVPISHQRNREGRILFLCDYRRPRAGRRCRTPRSTTVRDPQSNTIVLCPGFWNYNFNVDHRSVPEAETQFEMVVRELLKMPAIYNPMDDWIAPRAMRNDDNEGVEYNVNRYAHFMQDLRIHILRLQNTAGV